MCGLVAVFSPSEQIADDDLARMRDRLSHRGPDGADSWFGSYPAGHVALGFRRLAIIDTRHEADQPMVSADGSCVIVMNGEIYNYVELRQELRAAGRRFRTDSDTEVLLQAYEQWGDAMLSRLNGMFSFIIWDARSQQALIVRDRFGEKPLYWTRLTDGGLAFGSEIKALLAHPTSRLHLDVGSISRVLHGYLHFGMEDTLFGDVQMFRAAHAMRVTAAGEIVSYTSYWQPRYGRQLGDLPRSEVEALFRGHIERAVKQRMRADVPVTACLSGGLDSSSLVALMAPQGLTTTISARFPDDPTMDEGFHIDRVLQRTGLKGERVSPDAQDLVRDLRAMHWHQETIIPGVSMYLEWAVMQRAHELGFKVIIDGQGGDEVLAGYQIYFQAWQAEMARSGKTMAALLAGWRRDRRLRRTARSFSNPARRFSQRDSLTLDQLRGFHQNHVRDMQALYEENGLPDPDEAGALRFELGLNLLRTSLPSNLFSGDRNSMAHSVECRYPFLDYELVDFAAQLPDWAYLDQAWSKNILRSAMSDLLGPEILWRVDKMGFVAPQDRWMRHPAMEAWVADRLTGDVLSAVEGYSRDRLEKLLQTHRQSEADHSDVLWRWASAAELLDIERQGEWRD